MKSISPYQPLRAIRSGFHGARRDILESGFIMFRADHNQQVQLAHGFNEELTIILNSAAMVASLLGPGHPAHTAVAELKESAARCAELTRRIVRSQAGRRSAGLRPGQVP